MILVMNILYLKWNLCKDVYCIYVELFGLSMTKYIKVKHNLDIYLAGIAVKLVVYELWL